MKDKFGSVLPNRILTCMRDDKKYKLIKETVFVKQNNRFAIMFDYVRGKTFILNKTGAFIAELLKTPRTLTEMVNFLKQEFPGVNYSFLKKDLKIFLDDLKSRNLIKEVNHS